MNHYLTEEEQSRLLAVVKQYSDDKARRDYHMISALIHSGMRIGEFLLITVGDVVNALNSGYLYIPKENRKGGKRDHSVYITKSLRHDLVNLLSIRESLNGADYLIAGRSDFSPMCARNVQKRVREWADLAGLSYLQVTPHFFRHTHAMNIVRNSTAREPLRIVKAALGHRSLNTTAVYTEPGREEIGAALDETDKGRGKRVTIAALRRLHQGSRS